MATTTVSSGQTSSGIVLHSSDTMTVEAGGTAIATSVQNGGLLIDRGTTSGSRVRGGGFERVSSGGVAVGTVVSSGGNQEVFADGSAVSAVVSNGGFQTVDLLGRATDTVVDSGGSAVVFVGATTSDTIVNSGGTEWVNPGATASDTRLVGLVTSTGSIPADQVVLGTVISTLVSSGGSQTVDFSGVASDTQLFGSFVISGGVAARTAFEFVSAGGTAISTVAGSGGNERVSSGGVASATVVSSGGLEHVLSSGTAVGIVLSAGGTAELEAGAIASGTIAFAGGDTTLRIDGTTMPNVPISAFAAGETIDLAGIPFSAGDTETYSGTTLTIANSGGAALAQLTIVGPARFALSADPVTSGIDIFFNSITVSSGQTVSGIVLNSGDAMTVLNGGTAIGTIVNSGGTLGDGGLTSLTTVRGGSENVGFRAVDDGALVIGGGTQTVDGSAAFDTVGPSGTQIVTPLGRTFDTIVSGGGTQILLTEAVGRDIRGYADSTVVLSGGFQIVSGALVHHTTVSSGGTLVLVSGGEASGTKLQLGGTLDIAELPFVRGATAKVNSHVLTVEAGGKAVYTQRLAGKYAGERFQVTSATGGGTDVTVVPCFAAGTTIATLRGEIPMEALAVGDRVTAHGGGTRPIVWIGERRVDCRAHPRPDLVWPIRIRAGAFAVGKPRRDLVLSPGHSVFCDGVLIPIEHLTNGATVAQERVDAVHYFHVELDRHDVVLAEGLPAESYLDDGNRAAFANGAVHAVLHPDFVPRGWADACAARCTEGEPLLATRRLLHERALALGWRIEPAADLRVIANGVPLAPAAAIAIGGKRARRKGTLYHFLLPRRTREACIRCGAGVPAWIDPASRDQRRLGARIGGIYVNGRVVPLGSRHLVAGFHPVERRGGERWRWTDGEARVNLPDRAQGDAAIALDLFVRDLMRQWIAPGTQLAQRVA